MIRDPTRQARQSIQSVALLASVTSFVTTCLADPVKTTWIGGQSGSWQTPSGWTGGSYPNNSATQTFDATVQSASFLGVDASSDVTVNRLTTSGNCYVALRAPGRRFTIREAATFNNGEFTFFNNAGGTLELGSV